MWDKLIEASPNDALYYTLHGFMNVELRNTHEAIVDLTRAIRLKPVNSNRFNGRRTTITEQVDWQFAVLYYDKIKDNLPTGCATWVEAALIEFMVGNYHTCLAKVNDAHNRFADGRLLFFRALAKEYLQLYSEALADYQLAISHDADIFDAYKKLGLLHYEQNQLGVAINNFSEMIRLDSTSVIAFKYRGLTKSALNDHYGAMLDLTSAIAYDATDAELFYNRSLVRQTIGDSLGAFVDCQQTLYLDSGYQMAYFQYVQLAITNNQLNKAEAIMQAYINRFKEDHKVNNYLGIVKNLSGDNEAAIKFFTRSISINPYYVVPHINRGKVYYSLKAYQKAIEDYDQAISLSGQEEPEMYYLRALALHKLKKKRKACMDIIQAVKLGLAIEEEEIKKICH